MQSYFFVLGNTPALSLFELQNVLPSADVKEVIPGLATATLETDQNAVDAMTILGGTIKIIRFEKNFVQPAIEEIQQKIVELLCVAPKKAIFAISFLGFNQQTQPDVDAAEVKKALQLLGKKSRYIESTKSGLSAALLLHRPITEFYLIQTPDGIILGSTVTVQDIDDWTNRDRAKPYADSRKGMLPPKVARIMVNTAIEIYRQNSTAEVILYDPFCGTGTVLMEGLGRKLTVIGSDLDSNAVKGSINNLTWLKEFYSLPNSFTVLHDDAAHFLPPADLCPNVIVTEPFLGKPNPKPTELANIFRGLEKLYLGAFRHWRTFLPNNAVISIVFPMIFNGNKRFSLESLIDKLSALGYTTISEPIVYKRPQAVVERQIYWFTYNKGK